MTTRPARRDILRLAGLATVAATAAACTASSATKSSSAPAPGTPASTPPVTSGSPAPSTSTTAPQTTTSTTATRGTGPRPQYSGLSRQLGGTLARPGQSAYRPADLLYNPRFGNQAKPKAIAYVQNAADVAACVRFAASGGAALRMRNGGHSYGGWSSGPGLVVDMSAIDGVQVDRSAMTATVGAGARLAQVYDALGAQGVSIGAGSCATVGVTGLTLGGGIGLLTRQYGLTCDQLVSAQVVTADGSTRTASRDEHPDLFWALRGGGGSFGAVTSLTFRVRPAPTMQTAYLTWSNSDDAVDVLNAWQHWAPTTPRQLMTTCRVTTLPGQQPTTHVALWWAGSGSPQAQVQRFLASAPRPDSSFAPYSNGYRATMFNAASCSPSGSADQCIAASLSDTVRQPESAASSIIATQLPQRALQALVSAVAAAADVPGIVSGNAQFDALGGAVSDLGAADTAYPWRSAIADVQYDASWKFAAASDDPGRYDRFVHKARAALTPYVGDSAYSNYADPQLRNYAGAYWGANLARLQSVKKTYDPHNVFSWAQSVPS